jgi:xanthine dehydrogenase accessory factor
MIEWIDQVRRIAPREAVAMISVLATEGSAPRGPGTRMLVTLRGDYGTIGGGKLEFQAAQQARAILGLPVGSWRIQDYPLGPLLGQCCGGRVRLLLEHVDPARLAWLDDLAQGSVLVTRLEHAALEREVIADGPVAALSARGDKPGIGARLTEPLSVYRRPLYLFGAGHVGQAIANHAARLPLRLAWFDTRPAFAGLEGVTMVDEATLTDCVEDAPDDACILILTHDHGLDYRLTRAALQRNRLAFVGLIGSATKRARFFGRLVRDGIGAEARGRLVCPIGVSGVTGKEPDVIAIAVLAQLLQLGVA